MQPVFRNPFAPGGHFWRQIPTRSPPGASVSGPGHSASRPRHLRRMPGTSAAQAPADRTFRSAQTGGSVPFRPDIPPRTSRILHPLSTGHAPHGRPLSTQGQAQKNGTAAHSLRRGRYKKTGRQPTLGPARGTGYRDASSCRRPAICGKISAQITRRTGTARQPGQPVVQI